MNCLGMSYTSFPLRPGMTAIAAALALSSTPLVAQDAATAEPAVPVIAAPPPGPVAAEPVQAAPVAPSAMLNIPQISVNMDDAPNPAVESTVPAATQRMNDVPVRPAEAKAPAPNEAATISRPMASADAAPAPVAPAAPVAEPPPPPAAAVSNTAPAPVADPSTADSEDILPVAGGVLGALALIGGAFAMVSRRRRYSQTEDTVGYSENPNMIGVEEPLALTMPVAEQPAVTRAPVAAPAMAPAADLPAGFDMSRYGRHVQAAYRGPTADNPSLSLRTRLKRARFYDQRERMASTEAVMPATATAPKQPVAPQPERRPEYVTSRRFGGGSGSFRPAFQS